jgi:hypothetical protein
MVDGIKKYVLILMFPASLIAGDWTRADTITEGSYLALHCMDWMQTLQIRDPNQPFHELNPIFGSKPSRARVNTLFFTGAIGHVLISSNLSPRWRHTFQAVTIGMEAGCVGNNYLIGVRVKF